MISILNNIYYSEWIYKESYNILKIKIMNKSIILIKRFIKKF